MKMNEQIDVIDAIISLASEVLEKNTEAFNVFLKKYGERFFTAPATASGDRYMCKPGGLAEHSLNMYYTMSKLCDMFFPDRYTKETIFIVSILHDAGKCGDSRDEMYKLVKSGHNLKRVYELNQATSWASHSRLSLFIAQDCGFKLTEEEFQAILFHDGQGGNPDFYYNWFPLTIIVYISYLLLLTESVSSKMYPNETNNENRISDVDSSFEYTQSVVDK